MYSWYSACPRTGSYSRFGISTQTDLYVCRKSSGKYGHGIKLNHVNFIRSHLQLHYGLATPRCVPWRKAIRIGFTNVHGMSSMDSEPPTAAQAWREVELTLSATRDVADAYIAVDVWADFVHDSGMTLR